MCVPSIPQGFEDNVRKTNLDLAYILPNVAACSAPTDKQVKKLYQNSLTTLCQTLSVNHGEQNWTILNLRTEKIGYDPKIIEANGGNFQYRPFLDNNAIPLDQLIKVIKEIDQYLSANGRRAVIIHYRHGKGRTGSIIVGYIMYKYNLNFGDANELFIKRRKIYKHGVSVPSQVRYLEYYQLYIQSENVRLKYDQLTMHNPTITVTKLVIHGLKWNRKLETFLISCQTFGDDGSKLVNKLDLYDRTALVQSMGSDLVLIPRTPLQITDQLDISFQFTMTIKSITVFMLWFWINVGINPSSLNVTIPWNRMDGYRGSQRKGLKLFESVQILLSLS
ncbi:hypothetical protein FOA43_004118 [Brettanomyces nanus]|uniref:Uncharacterized protein n=1 Tax=Eeniella nana TaxID=13502 RepID=A0A875SDC8_EENNA|nr:uncharacterized protein FOA43_004118 [Brettanomyces nanus]QPG76724.1 hypothetical protein FOA43_004118 [Brettanomyces nanus]